MQKAALFSNLQRFGGWAVAFVVVGLAVAKTTTGLENLMDVRFYDESYYLTQGLFQPISSWIADYSALYSIHYKILARFTGSDAIDLYYANYRFWSFVFGCVVFSVLRRSGCSLTFSLIWAVASTCAQINLPLWPKAGHLAMAGVAIGLLGIQPLKDRPSSFFAWISGLFLCLSWCRPEFLVGSALALLAGFLAFLAKGTGQQQKLPWFVLLPWLCAVLAFYVWGLPVGGSGRGEVAFGQHFVHNWRNITHHTSNDLMEDWVNWREIYHRVLGPSNGILAALFSNPLAFGQHLWFNTKYLIYNSYLYFFESLFPFRLLGLSVSLCLAGLWLGAEYFHRFNGLATALRQAKTGIKSYGYLLVVMALPSVMAGLLFQPRPHYILPLFPLFLFGMGKLASVYTFPQLAENHKFGIGAGMVVAILLFLPDAGGFYALRAKGEQSKTHPDRQEPFGKITSEGLQQKELIRRLQTRNWPAQCRLFDASTGATEYLGTRVVQCGKIGFEMNYKSLEDFPAFLEREKVSHIFLRSTIQYDHFFQKNRHWQQLRSNPESLGWTKIAVSPWGDSLLVKK